MNLSYKHDVTHIVLLQPTSPFTKPKTITSCINLAIKTSCDTVITGYKDPANHPSLLFSSDSDSSVSFIKSDELTSRRQDFPITQKDLVVVMSLRKTHYLILTLCMVQMFVQSWFPKKATNIDEPNDIIVAQALYGRERNV